MQELTGTLSLSQPTVSHHLKTLQLAGIVKSKREGTWIYYSLTPSAVNNVGKLVEGFLSASNEADGGIGGALGEFFQSDITALRAISEERRDRSRGYFDSVANRWKELRNEAQRNTSYLDVLSRSVVPDTTLLELGCGSGAFLETILPRNGTTIAVDYSQAMLDAARKTLGTSAANVDFRLGYLEHLPVGDESIDHAVIYMVLHHVVQPLKVLRDLFRVLKKNGKVSIVDLTPHTDETMRERYADLWLGFSPDEVTTWLTTCGFTNCTTSLFEPNKEAFKITAIKS